MYYIGGSDKYAEQVIRNISDGILIIDKSWTIQTWNPACERQLKFKKDEVEGRNILEVFPYWKDDKPEKAISKVFSNGESIEEEIIGPGELGREPHTFRVKFCPLSESKEKIDGVMLVVEDVSDRTILERQLIISERLAAIGKLAASVAHELNNPLDGVIRYTNLCLDHAGEDGLIREYLLNVKEGLNRMTTVVRSLLEFSRQAKTDTSKVTTDVNKTIENALLLIGHRTLYQDVEITKNLKQDLPLVLDGGLEQVFTNILNNAFDAMPKGGRLIISTDTKDNLVEVKFRDTGYGIPEELQTKIFEPFFTTKEIGKGTGLGLAICSEIIKRCGGDISINSKIGEGSTFTVYLPTKF